MYTMRSPRASYHATPIQQQPLQRQSRAMHEYPLCWIFMRHGEPAQCRWLQSLLQEARCYLVTLLLIKIKCHGRLTSAWMTAAASTGRADDIMVFLLTVMDSRPRDAAEGAWRYSDSLYDAAGLHHIKRTIVSQRDVRTQEGRGPSGRRPTHGSFTHAECGQR